MNSPPDYEAILASIADEPPTWPLPPPAEVTHAYSASTLPAFDLQSHNQSTTSFGSTNTGRTGIATPSVTYASTLSIPDAVAAQLSTFDLNSGLGPVFRALSSYASPLLASKESFERKFPVWKYKSRLDDILAVASSLALHCEAVVPLDDRDGKLTIMMMKYTPLAVYIIVAGDAQKGGTFGTDGAPGLYFMNCIVQWAVDLLVTTIETIRHCGRRTEYMEFYGIVPVDHTEAKEVNSITFATLASEWSYLNDSSIAGFEFLSHPVPWAVVADCFYNHKNSLYRKMMSIFARYPSLKEGSNGTLWQSMCPPSVVKLVLIGLKHNFREFSLEPRNGKLHKMIWDEQDDSDLYLLHQFLSDDIRNLILQLKCAMLAQHCKATVRLAAVVEPEEAFSE